MNAVTVGSYVLTRVGPDRYSIRERRRRTPFVYASRRAAFAWLRSHAR